MKRKTILLDVLKITMVSALMVVPMLADAQPGPGPGGGGPPPVPIDGGLTLLLGAGAALGISKLRNRKSK